jgi:ribosomal protein S18 acetylase RimI-like enzyme
MEIRKASKSDKGNIAELIYSAGPELYGFIYKTDKKTAIEYIQYEFNSGQGFCGYNNVTVAVKDGIVVGTGCFYDGVLNGKLMLGTTKNMFRFYGPIKIWKVLFRTRHIGSVMTTPKKNELYLSNFGVSAKCRSTGVGSAMLGDKINSAKKGHYKIFSLDVADTNPRAEALYKKHGLEIVKTKKFTGKREGIEVPLVKKMELLVK